LDPRIHFGEFENGLRFAWADNPEPDRRVYLRLHVDVGSLAEEESERGMAHFLEHMAFNGSEHFAAGELVGWFQERGMSFGADTNAHTNFSETLYKIDLPEADEASLAEGLLVLRDYADGLLLADEEIEAEKGVIDGEERERDSAGYRLYVRQLEKLCAGTRVATRSPIGTKEARDAFTGESVRAFYERWYRPENMTLVAVGDLDGLNPEGLFAAAFGDMAVPQAAPEEEPGRGTPPAYAFSFHLYEPEIPTVTLVAEVVVPYEDEPDNAATRLEDLSLNVARAMINLRFSELVKEEGAPFIGASAGDGGAFELFDGEGLYVTAAPEKWEEALAFCEQELRRALRHGFQGAELDEVRADVLRSLDEAVDREPTAHSKSLLSSIVNAAEERYVPMNAADRRALVRPAVEALTTEACHLALVQAWDRGELSLYALGGLDLRDASGNSTDTLRLASVWDASTRVAVEAPEVIETNSFAYASRLDRAGTVAENEYVEDLDLHLVRFENGVRLNIKATDYKEKQILLRLRVGEGQLTLEPDRAAVAWVADQIFTAGGLGAHSSDDLRRLMAGRQVGIGFSVGEDAFVLNGGTTAEDLLLEFELACAWLTDPGWRPDGLVQLRRQLPQLFESLLHIHQGPQLTVFDRALHGGDPRFGLPDREAIEDVEMDDLRTWLAEHLRLGELEITVVGDLDVEDTITHAAQTFGLLEMRQDLGDFDERRSVPATVTGLIQDHTIDTEVPRSAVHVVFPTTDGFDVVRRRSLFFLGYLLSDRLRIEVRERLGVAYSPRASADSSRVYRGLGTITIEAGADPALAAKVLEACLNVADGMARGGIEADEVDRMREPILKQLRDGRRSNSFWLSLLDEAQTDGKSLDNIRSLDAFYVGIGPEDLVPLAREYLTRERASVLLVSPQTDEADDPIEAGSPKEE
jgi:zinc protease